MIKRLFWNVLIIVWRIVILSTYPEICNPTRLILSSILNGLKIEINIPAIKSSKLVWKANPRTTTNKLELANNDDENFSNDGISEKTW